AWKRYKDLLRACPHYGFTELHQPDTFYNALNPVDQDSLNAAAGGNLLEKSPQDALTIIENKSKVRNSRNKPIASPVNACDNHSSSELAKLTHAVNQQASAEKIKRMNDVSLKSMQNQIDMVKNELRNEMKTSIQTSLSNQTNEIKNMMASLLQMNTASTSGSGTLSGNTIANPKGELKAITTRSGLVTEGPTVPNPPKPVNP
nr:reverse transcriptase domain-containing protein [Tanacetum cinerariifolium]